MTTAAQAGPRPHAGASPAEPMLSRLSLDPPARPGTATGSWQPGTRHPVAELTRLVEELAEQGVVATSLSVSVADWTGTPGRLHLRDRDVRLQWLAYGAAHAVTVRHQTGRISLAIVPPDAGPPVPTDRP